MCVSFSTSKHKLFHLQFFLPPSLPPSFQTKAGFAEGVKSIMNALPNMLKTMKDPTISTRALSELLADDAEGMTVSEGGREGGVV